MAEDKHLGRRKHYRLKITYLVCYRAKNSSGSWGYYDYTLTRDIGVGGMFIITDRKFSPGTEMEIIIRLPLYPDKKIEAKGEVVSFENIPERKMVYKTRVKFTNFDELLFWGLGEFIRTEMEKDVGGMKAYERLDRRKKGRDKTQTEELF
ncbi:MAG: PilZ domain-containing protein [Candidatus Omnitrophota bacterium]